jgi:uncharacterized protein (TIGR02145 family)
MEIRKLLTGRHGKAVSGCMMASLLLLAVSCTKDDPSGGKAKVTFNTGEVVDLGDGTRDAVGLEKEVVLVLLGDGETLLECTLERSPRLQTRASMLAGTKFRVYVYKTDGSYVTSGELTAGGTDFITLDAGESYDIRAVSYYNSASTVPGDVTAALGTASLEVSHPDDVLWAKAGLPDLADGETSLTLNFTHKSIRVTVVADATARDQEITACAATFSPGKEHTLFLDGGTLAATGTDVPQDITWSSLNAQKVTSDPAYVYSTTGQANHTLAFSSITVGGTTYTNTSVPFSKALEPGYAYTLTVTFKGDIPSIDAGGLKWVTSNLHETTTSGVYALFANPYDYSGTMSGGDYWNWGAVNPRTDYSSYYNGTSGGWDWSASPSATTDPCRAALGGTWRLPTWTDLEHLVFNEQHVWGAYATSGAGDGINGQWFCTDDLATAQASPGSYLFFPAAGARSYSSASVSSMGTSGVYWSREFSSTSTAYGLVFNSNDVYTFSDARIRGLSVRCVRD